MQPPVYIGDEVSEAGYRLAGVRVHVPARDEANAAFDEACARAPVVLVSAAIAMHIDDARMRVALQALWPLVLIVPDIQGDVPRPDLAARLRGQLGMEA
jgi:vacuolar-type H+-ATPase subunit F/Vma7